MTRTLSFGDSGDARRTLASWVPKLREIVARLIKLEEDVYTDSETLTNKRYFGAPVYRKVVNFGALPNTGTKSVNHGISDFGRIWICPDKSEANNGVNTWVPLPYVDTVLSNNIEIRLTATQVVIVTATNYSNYNGLVVLEYTKK